MQLTIVEEYTINCTNSTAQRIILVSRKQDNSRLPVSDTLSETATAIVNIKTTICDSINNIYKKKQHPRNVRTNHASISGSQNTAMGYQHRIKISTILSQGTSSYRTWKCCT